jgi:hypothetical protein
VTPFLLVANKETNMGSIIIGLGFKARNGKGVTAAYLRSKYGFRHGAFADKLKEAAAKIFGLSYDQCYGDLKEVVDPFWNDTPRNILQKMGTECMRNGYRQDIWVKALERTILEGNTTSNKWAIEDVRFPEEAKAIKQWGGLLVRIDRPGAPRIATAQHASETAMESWDQWDYVLDNSGDLPQLYRNIDQMMTHFKEQ